MKRDLTFGGYELTLRIPDFLNQLDRISLSSAFTISFHFPNSPLKHRVFINAQANTARNSSTSETLKAYCFLINYHSSIH